MQLKCIIPEVFASNSYILFDEESKEAALIDSSNNPKAVIKEIEKLGAKLKYILLTHAHFDHVGGVYEIKEHFPDAKVMLNREDLFLLENLKVQCDMFGTKREKKPQVDEFVDENSTLTLGNTPIKVIHTKGHSKGSSCYLIEDMLFCGDTLFYEEIGRCDLPGGDFSEIEKSIRDKLFKLDDNVKVYTGHGQSTTIGHEKIHNAYFGENSIY